MNFFRLALVFALPTGLALACGDDDGNSPGFGGPGGEQSNGGSAGSNGDAGSNGLSGSGNAGDGSGGSGNASNGSGGSGNLGGDATVQDICRRGCAKTDPLNCPNDEPNCEANCIQEAASGQDDECRTEVIALATCVADRPASDFFCGEDGTSTVRDDVCNAEGLAVFNCAFASEGGF